jgi:hypothetical protein
MSIGYFADLNDAEDYFTDERLVTDAWDDLDNDSPYFQKNKVITNAYNRLYYDPRWELPTYAEASATALVRLRKANGEMAYYLAVHLADEDRRKGIQAQGVIEAGVVKEKYSENWLDTLPIPPFVEALLGEWAVGETVFGAIDLARDETESVTTKVHDF